MLLDLAGGIVCCKILLEGLYAARSCRRDCMLLDLAGGIVCC